MLGGVVVGDHRTVTFMCCTYLSCVVNGLLSCMYVGIYVCVVHVVDENSLG